MARSQKFTNEDRIQITLSPTTRLQLMAILEMTDASSLAEVVRQSVRLYAHVLEMRRVGDRLLVRSRDGVEREVLLW